jgi:beta-N-acetylhexosaminidase
MKSVRQAAGSLLIVGLEGPELAPLERAWLRLIQTAGIILFRRNISDARQTRTLLAEATSLCAPHSLRLVDLEGGPVDRLRDALAPLPSAHAVAQAMQTAGKNALAREHGELTARAASAFGFNVTLAPVLDLGLPESAEVMGARCSSPSAQGVIDYAREFLAGLSTHSIAGCGKHFPGLGGGTLDSHKETPRIERQWRNLWQDDMEPYRALCRHLPMVMVNHAAYPLTRGKDRPASVSDFWIETVLKKRIGYRGIIFSDDFEMGGILNFLPIEEAVVEAVRAGMDLVEICHSPELILRAFESLVTAAERSASFRSLLLARARTAAQKRARRIAPDLSPLLSARQFESLRRRILRFSEQVAALQEGSAT